jgi:tight adherence protein C
MIVFLFGIGLILVAVAARVFMRGLVVDRLQLKAHLRDLSDYGFETGIPDADLPALERLKRAVRRAAIRIGGFLLTRVPTIPSLSKSDLTAAGFYDITPEAVHGYRLMGAIGLPGTFFLLIMLGGKISSVEILLLVVSVAAGWQLPAFLIRKRGTGRLDDIERQLPELIDLLIATVEAGMGFAASLDLVAQRLDGALGDELRLTMKQQSLGISMQAALDDLGERCHCASVRAFVRTASRGETMGGSIGPVLRELSTEERRRRRQAARERMQKAPVKMIFPLMFLIMPALMIVLMYPAAYSVMTNLSSIGGG